MQWITIGFFLAYWSAVAKFCYDIKNVVKPPDIDRTMYESI